MKKRILCLLLVILLILSVAPAIALAGEDQPVAIPEEETPELSYTGAPFKVEDIFGEELAAAIEIVAVNEVETDSPDFELLSYDVGEYSVRVAAKEGYELTNPDEGQSYKTVAVEVIPKLISDPEPEMLAYRASASYTVGDFFPGDDNAEFRAAVAGVDSVTMNGEAKERFLDAGVYAAQIRLNGNYVFEQPDSAELPNVKTYTLQIGYTVSFSFSGLACAVDPQLVLPGGRAYEPENYKFGDEITDLISGKTVSFAFRGWYHDEECVEQPWNFGTDTISGDTVIHAKVPRIWTVHFDTGFTDEEEVPQIGQPVPQDQRVVQGDLVTRPANPEFEGYIFRDWFKTNVREEQKEAARWDFTKDTPTLPLDPEDLALDELTLYSRWDKNDFTVEFDLNLDGLYAQINPQEHCKYGDPVIKPEGYEEGKTLETIELQDGGLKEYIFCGWYTNEDCTGSRWNFSKDIIESNMTLYGCWKEACHVIYSLNGHGSMSTDQMEAIVAKGDKLVKPTNPTAKGYFFVGWYTEKTCKNQWRFNTYTVDQSMTLYAKWTTNNPRTGDNDTAVFYTVLSVMTLASGLTIILGNRKKQK